VQRVLPAQYRTTAQNVLIAPARREWQVTRDGLGREIGCWVNVPAQYALQHQQVMIAPERVVEEVVPAIYGTRNRVVLVKDSYITTHTLPAEYATRHRTVELAPARSSWERLR
jgi:hypothetical protein